MYDLIMLLAPFPLIALNYFIPDIVKEVVRAVGQSNPPPPTEIATLLEELSKTSITDEMAKHLKLKRKINTLKEAYESEVATLNRGKMSEGAKCMMITSLLTFIISAVVCLLYSTTPVVVLNEDWLDWPLSGLVRWPVAIPGAVSFHCWYLMCSRIVGLVGEFGARK